MDYRSHSIPRLESSSVNLRDLILPPGDTIDRIDLDKAAGLIEAARALGAESFAAAEDCIRSGSLMQHQADEKVVRAFQLVSEAVKICEYSRDFQIMAIINCLKYDYFEYSYLDLLYIEIVQFLQERDCGDDDAFRGRCLLSSVARIDIAASTMNISSGARKNLHILLGEARFTSEDVKLRPDAGDRRERLNDVYTRLKFQWAKIGGPSSVWD